MSGKGNASAPSRETLGCSFPFYFDDYLASPHVAEMSLGAQGLYVRLLCRQYQVGPLPSAPRALARIAGVDRTELDEFMPELSKRFVDAGEGRIENPRMREIRNKRLAYVEERSRVGKLGGRPTKAIAKAPAKGVASVDQRLPSPSPSPSPLQSPSPEKEQPAAADASSRKLSLSEGISVVQEGWTASTELPWAEWHAAVYDKHSASKRPKARRAAWERRGRQWKELGLEKVRFMLERASAPDCGWKSLQWEHHAQAWDARDGGTSNGQAQGGSGGRFVPGAETDTEQAQRLVDEGKADVFRKGGTTEDLREIAETAGSDRIKFAEMCRAWQPAEEAAT